MEEGVIAKWHKKEGDFVNAGELLLEITTDKATLEHNALDEGYLRKIVVPEGKRAHVNQPIAIFTAEANEDISSFEVAPKKKQEEKPVMKEEQAVVEREVPIRKEMAFTPEAPLEKYVFEQSDDTIASPLAKKIAKEKGLDLTSVKGSGPGGRITSEDLNFALPEGIVSFGKKSKPTTAPGTYEEVELTPMRSAIGKRLAASKSTVPHFYVTQKINAEPMVRLREELKNLKMDKITFNDMIIKAVALALKKHPQINTGFNSLNQTLIQFKTIDISVAVTIEGGLITPIIRHADYKNLGEISIEMRRLAEKARNGQLKEEEYKGGSFSISNLGMYGISEFTAVINPPQGAILAIGGIQDEPVVKDGKTKKVVPGKTLSLTISADHRVIDGTDAAIFLKTLKEILENPIALAI